MSAYRSRVKRRKDINTFARTANRVRKANVSPRVMRGGIRL